MKRKIIIIIMMLLVITGGLAYFKSHTTYNVVQKYRKQEKTESARELSIKDNKTQGLNTNNNNLKKENKSYEDIAMDKRLKEYREENIKTWKNHSAVRSSFDSGKAKFSENEFTQIYKPIDEFVFENRDKYLHSDDPTVLTSSTCLDERAIDLIYGQPLKYRKGIIKGKEDNQIALMEIRRLDDNWDIVLLIKEDKSDTWKIVFIGDYYQLKDFIQDSY